jgi:hypothetical protein
MSLYNSESREKKKTMVHSLQKVCSLQTENQRNILLLKVFKNFLEYSSNDSYALNTQLVSPALNIA